MARGLRWPKGGASSSNPTQHKHRDAARRQFRAQLSSAPAKGHGHARSASAGGLTEAALADHNAAAEDAMDATPVLSGIGAGPGQLFASVVRHVHSAQESHREACAVLAAVQELIREQQLPETEAAYFGALMSAAEVQAAPSEGDEGEAGRRRALAAIGQLLALVIPHVPAATLRARFAESAEVLVRALEGVQAEEDEEASGAAAKHLLGCVGALLHALQGPQWSHPSAMQACAALIVASSDSRPKIRKRAQDELFALLRAPPPPTAFHPAGAAVAQHLAHALADVGGPHALHAAHFARRALPLLPAAGVKDVCQGVLALVATAQPVPYTVGMETLAALFDAAAGSDGAPGLTAALNGQLLSALAEYQPSAADAQALSAWLAAVTKGVRSLARGDEDLSLAHAARFAAAVIPALLADRADVAAAAGGALVDMMRALSLCPDAIARRASQGLGPADQGDNPLTAIARILEDSLKFRFQPAWAHVLAATAAFFEAAGVHVESVGLSLLAATVALRLTRRFSLPGEAEQAIAAAARAVGPRAFLRMVPLDISTEGVQTEFPKSFLLPLLKDNIRRAELAFFASELLPLAGRLRDHALALAAEGREIERRPFAIFYVQVWSLLPGFMAHCVDGRESFKSVAKALGVGLSERPELRQVICRGLVSYIDAHRATAANENASPEERARAAACIDAAARFAQQFLNVLFQSFVSETEPEAKTHFIEAIAAYVNITEKGLLNNMFKTVARNLIDLSVSATAPLSPEARARRHSMMDLAQAMLSRLDAEGLALVCRLLIPQLVDSDGVLQKKTYKALATICRSEEPEVATFCASQVGAIGRAAAEALGAVHASAKKARVKCLAAVVSRLGDADLGVVPYVVAEAVLGTKESGEKARGAAFDLLIAMGHRMRAAGDANAPPVEYEGTQVAPSLGEYFRMVVASLHSPVPHTTSAAIVALARLLYEFKDVFPRTLRDDLIAGVAGFLRSPSREVVRSALGFAKVAAVILPPDDLRALLPTLVSPLDAWTDEMRHHVKHKARVILERLVRKLGFDAVEAAVPESHRRLLANIRKTKEREKRRKAAGPAAQEDAAPARQTENKGKRGAHSEYERAFGSDDEASMSEEDAEDSDAEVPRGRARGKKAAATWIREDEEADAPLDFLGTGVISRVVSTKPRKPAVGVRRKNPFAVTGDGRLVVTDLDSAAAPADMDVPMGDAATADAAQQPTGGAARGKRKRTDDEDEGAAPAAKRSAGEARGDGPKGKGKGRGDAKGGKLEPFAYMPLQPKFLNKRTRNRASGRFAGLVKAAQKGTDKGRRAAKAAARR